MAEINIGCRLMWGDVFLALRLVDLGAGAVDLGIGSNWLGGVSAAARFRVPGSTPDYIRSTEYRESTSRVRRKVLLMLSLYRYRVLRTSKRHKNIPSAWNKDKM